MWTKIKLSTQKRGRIMIQIIPSTICLNNFVVFLLMRRKAGASIWNGKNRFERRLSF